MYKGRKQLQGPKVPKRPPKKREKKTRWLPHSVCKITQNVSLYNTESEETL